MRTLFDNTDYAGINCGSGFWFVCLQKATERIRQITRSRWPYVVGYVKSYYWNKLSFVYRFSNLSQTMLVIIKLKCSSFTVKAWLTWFSNKYESLKPSTQNPYKAGTFSVYIGSSWSSWRLKLFPNTKNFVCSFAPFYKLGLTRWKWASIEQFHKTVLLFACFVEF